MASRSAVRHPGATASRIAAQRLGDHQPGGPHLARSAPASLVRWRLLRAELRGTSRTARTLRRRRQPPYERSASMARTVTSSTGPVASMPDQLALGAVVVDQRRGLVARTPAAARRSSPALSSSRWNSSPPQRSQTPSLGGRRRTRRARSCRSRGRCAGRRAAGSPRRRRRPAPAPGPARCRGRPAACPARRPAARSAGSRRAGSPSAASGSASRSRTMLMVTSSGTSSPASMYRLASTPSGVPWATLARKMSPVEIFGHGEVRGDELRLGALARARRANQNQSHLPQEPFVVALHELALDLLHRLQADADHDQHRGAAEREVLVLLPPSQMKKKFGRIEMMPR